MIDETMPYSALEVANYFIELERKSGDKPALTPMKLQKLVYFAHGWQLALADTPLIDERIEAWQFGPVVPSLYHEFKGYGNEPIAEPATVLRPDGALIQPTMPSESDALPLLNRIDEVYGKYDGVQLSNATHQPGTPWFITWEENGGKSRRGTDIPDELIQGYFRKSMVKK